jgi:hypothetical protein
MQKRILSEGQVASDYDDRITIAVRSVLIEIGQVLGSFKGKFAVVGGAVPWLLLNEHDDMPHVGTLDVDLGLDAEALGDGEYAGLVQALLNNGYRQQDTLRRFQLVRQVRSEECAQSIDVVVDFLMPREVTLVKNSPPLLSDFAVQKADGAELAVRFYQLVAIAGFMPDGVHNRVEIAVCSIPALLAMKGYAISGRYKQKDAYDIYYCIRNYPDGHEALARDCQPLMKFPTAVQGYRHIAAKFENIDSFGPTCVRRFVSATKILGGRTPQQWQQDAFGQVNAWIDSIGPL